MTSNDSGANPPENDEDPNDNDSADTELTLGKALERKDASIFRTHFQNPYTKQRSQMNMHIHDVMNAVLNGEPVPLQDPHTERDFDVFLEIKPSRLRYRRLSDDEIVEQDISPEPVTVKIQE